MTGYIVPDDPSPTERIVRLICVPPDTLWQANIEGALSVLRQDYVWNNENGTAVAAAETADDIYFNFIGVTGDCVTELCSAVADCIENSPDVADALANVIVNNATVRNAIQQALANTGYGTGQGTPETPSVYNQDGKLLDGSLITGCDNDSLFGGITQLVDLMNTMITDIFEQIEASTEGAERWAGILEAIPITNVLAIDDLIQFADQLIENIGQSYAGEYTAQLRDEFRCDLFCLVKDTCELDFQAWADYFMGKLGEAIVENAFGNAISWFIGGNFSNEEIVYAAHALICQVFAYGSRWLGIDMVWFGKVVTAAMNDPDADWVVLCDDCDEGWCYEWNFATNDGGFQLVNNTNLGSGQASDRGQYVNPQWQSTIGTDASGQPQGGVIIYIPGSYEFTVQTIEVEYSKLATSSNWNISAGAQNVGGAFNKVINQGQGTAQQDNTILQVTGVAVGENLRIELLTSGNDASKVVEVHRVKVSSAVGVNPFGTDNC